MTVFMLESVTPSSTTGWLFYTGGNTSPILSFIIYKVGKKILLSRVNLKLDNKYV